MDTVACVCCRASIEGLSDAVVPYYFIVRGTDGIREASDVIYKFVHDKHKLGFYGVLQMSGFETIWSTEINSQMHRHLYGVTHITLEV